MRFVIFQVNADFLINQLTKYFYARHLTRLLYFKKKKKKGLFNKDVFKNIHFSLYFY